MSNLSANYIKWLKKSRVKIFGNNFLFSIGRKLRKRFEICFGLSSGKGVKELFQSSNSQKFESFEDNLVAYSEKTKIVRDARERIIRNSPPLFDMIVPQTKEQFQYPERAQTEYCFVVNHYPDINNHFSSAFVHRRVLACKTLGKNVRVICRSTNSKGQLKWVYEGVNVEVKNNDQVLSLAFNTKGIVFMLHSPDPDLLVSFAELIDHSKFICVFHGYECRDYFRLEYNYSVEYLKSHAIELEWLQARRLAALQIAALKCPQRLVFVSNFLRSIAEKDTGCSFSASHIIPNILANDFIKSALSSDRTPRKVLSIKNFDRPNYAGDIVVKLLETWNARPDSEKLEFTLVGFGKYFEEFGRKVSTFENVEIVEGPLSAEEMKDLYKNHQILLSPTRFETQGMLLCEAAGSGLAIITNAAGAVSEFFDFEGVYLSEERIDLEAFTMALEELAWLSEERLNHLRRRTKNLMSLKLSAENTIVREMSLFG